MGAIQQNQQFTIKVLNSKENRGADFLSCIMYFMFRIICWTKLQFLPNEGIIQKSFEREGTFD